MAYYWDQVPKERLKCTTVEMLKEIQDCQRECDHWHFKFECLQEAVKEEYECQSLHSQSGSTYLSQQLK